MFITNCIHLCFPLSENYSNSARLVSTHPVLVCSLTIPPPSVCLLNTGPTDRPIQASPFNEELVHIFAVHGSDCSYPLFF